MKYSNIREEAIKLKVAQDFFSKFDCTDIQGDVDFAVKLKRPKDAIDFADEYLLWAEAKKDTTDMLVMLTQLVLTIGKARAFDKYLPPAFLGCFDCGKIAFVPYHDIQDIFYQNDFNWKVAPSDHETKEFKQVYAQIKKIVENESPQETCLFDFEHDEKEIRRFVRDNFIVGKSDVSKIKIDKNNFIIIYNKWLETVKPSVQVNWDIAKKTGIIDGDFYLADLLSSENVSLKDKLFVLLKSNYYEANRRIEESGMFASNQVYFSDSQKAHTLFWNKYERPPHEDYWDYIVNRRDLLVPQDVRERKGSFFTPQIWVELSQRYIAGVLGENWQDEYYVWDCAAGTGNLLTGLANKYNIWASTLDKQDVDVMRDRIKNGANLLESHVFQFDFLNDDFSKLPQGLQDIMNDEKKRRKLVIYINPPYAEADNRKGEGRAGVAISKIHELYSSLMGYTKREIYIQFLTRIYCEIPGAVLADFSTLKNLQAPKFIDFRNFFKPKLLKCFLVPANSFDNVKGAFPVGFKIWDTGIKENFEHILADVYEKDGTPAGTKNVWAYDNMKFINDWVKTFRNSNSESVATIIGVGSDFQNQRLVRFGEPHMKVPADNHHWQVTKDNLIRSAIYYAVRHCMEATWLNDRDQFLFPDDGWENDLEFQNDCLAYTLFNNNIQSKHGTNHWIPFTEQDVNARDKFESNFMSNFIAGKKTDFSGGGGGGYWGQMDMFFVSEPEVEYVRKGRQFSKEANELFDAGRALWRYYHAQPTCNVNASLYDIREHFQGRSTAGKMNNASPDQHYNDLIANLRDTLKILAQKIVPKVYEYGFLKS